MWFTDLVTSTAQTASNAIDSVAQGLPPSIVSFVAVALSVMFLVRGSRRKSVAAMMRQFNLFGLSQIVHALAFLVNLFLLLYVPVLRSRGLKDTAATRIALHAVGSVFAHVVAHITHLAIVLYNVAMYSVSVRRLGPPPTRDKPLILLLHASIGSGHKRAAQACQAAIQERLPNAEVAVCDMLDFTGPLYEAIAKTGYLALIQQRLGATLYGYFFEASNSASASPTWMQRLMNLAVRAFFVSFYEMLLRTRPDLIINTHFLPPELIGLMQRGSEFATPVATLVTDYDVHSVWRTPCNQTYFVPRLESKLLLEAASVSHRIEVLPGIPIDPQFSRLPDKAACQAAAHKELVSDGEAGLTPNLPLVLQMSNGSDVGDILKGLLSMSTPASIVVITGRQADVRTHLRGVVAAASPTPHTVSLVGFTTLMHVFLGAADVIVSKPGGLTTAESLATGTPLVIANPIPGQETRNTDFLLEEGVAIKVNDLPLVGHKVGALLADADRLARLQANAAGLGTATAAYDVADWVVRQLQHAAADSGASAAGSGSGGGERRAVLASASPAAHEASSVAQRIVQRRRSRKK